jgi:hypothetical protein
MATYNPATRGLQVDHEAKSEQHDELVPVQSIDVGIMSENEIDNPVMHQKLLLVDKVYHVS